MPPSQQSALRAAICTTAAVALIGHESQALTVLALGALAAGYAAHSAIVAVLRGVDEIRKDHKP